MGLDGVDVLVVRLLVDGLVGMRVVVCHEASFNLTPRFRKNDAGEAGLWVAVELRSHR